MEERRIEHAAELYKVLRDPGLYLFLDEVPPQSVGELAKKLARSELRRSPDGNEHWLNWVVRAECGAMAGYVQATVEENKETNVAYVFSPKFQGQGIASAAVRQMLEILVSQYQASMFFIVAEAANMPSLQLAQRLGFTQAPSEVSAKRKCGPSEVLFWRRAAPNEA